MVALKCTIVNIVLNISHAYLLNIVVENFNVFENTIPIQSFPCKSYSYFNAHLADMLISDWLHRVEADVSFQM